MSDPLFNQDLMETPSVEQVGQHPLVSPFDLWWANELSSIPPKDEHDHSEHVYRMCKMVWDRWEDVASQIDCHSPESLLEEILLD